MFVSTSQDFVLRIFLSDSSKGLDAFLFLKYITNKLLDVILINHCKQVKITISFKSTAYIFNKLQT